MVYEIDKKDWHTCKICSADIRDLAKKYGGNGIYYTEVFRKHLLIDHCKKPEDYFNTPTCDCGICNKKMNINIKPSSNFRFSRACGRNDGVTRWSQEAKLSRLGSGNPMFNKKPWNKDIKMSTDFCKKMSNNAIYRTQRGDFKFTQTVPHKRVCSILDRLNIEHTIEYNYKGKLFDIFIPSHKILIEVDGDYWHCNPAKYPNGPINKIQEAQIKKDEYKNLLCSNTDMKLVRFWEHDILNNEKDIECTLKKLLL